MNLYDQEINESISPLAANMGWTITWQPEDREFIGARRWRRSAPPAIWNNW